MSVLFENNQGWILCHKTFLNKTYQFYIDAKSLHRKIKIKESYFNMRTPILMNSAAEKISKIGIKTYKSKVKKKKEQRNVEIGNYHALVKPIIEQAMDSMKNADRNMQVFEDTVPSAEEWFSNNSEAREAARNINFNNELLSVSESCVFHTHVGDTPVIEMLQNKSYLIPPHSSFLLCDIEHLHRLIGNLYDVIVMDPPWQNKSVRRKRGYSRMDSEDLLTLPVRELIKPGSLIAVWATNNEKQLTFIKEKLFPRWGVTYCTDWHWVKVTQRGVYVHSIDSTQNKPYENLILGRCKPRHDNESNFPDIEAHKVIVSVPSSIHSHKPPLTEILKPHLPENAKCLELFARYLLPGWTSCGNEVLKLQALAMFDDVQSEIDR